MPNKLLLTITISLLSFQIFFSVYYSSQIVNYNQKYSVLQKKYSDLKYENEKLEIEFVNKYALNGQQ